MRREDSEVGVICRALSVQKGKWIGNGNWGKSVEHWRKQGS